MRKKSLRGEGGVSEVKARERNMTTFGLLSFVINSDNRNSQMQDKSGTMR